MSSVAPVVDRMRHSCAHVMAMAIQSIWSTAKFGVGPATKNGFYYDVLFPEPISADDLAKIERMMRKIKASNVPFVQSQLEVEDARTFMQSKGQDFKVELIGLLKERGSTAVAAETGDANVGDESPSGLDRVSMFQVGDFVDLCRGPHVERTGAIGEFKLERLAGAYWRGDEKRPQLQRVYGLCFATAAELEAELERLEQVKLRDHRRLGSQLELFHLAAEVGQGLPLWLPKGTVLRDELEFLARTEERAAGFQRVSTPHITDERLYYQSGHLPYYQDDMYAPMEIDGRRYYLKPMNCPHHHHIYLSRPRSYRDLPIRLSEYGQVYRYENSGALSGIIRTRGFCQNDAHIYCQLEHAKDEFKAVMQMHANYYRLFGIEAFHMRLALPDTSRLEKYVDDPDKWLAALNVIRSAMKESGLPFTEAKGDAAFYGPKIDFIIESAIGTEYAISTNQLDFLASERFELTYKGEDGAQHPVYVIHRAPLGSHERFIAFLIEHYAGAFPLWLAPVQAVIVPVTDRHLPYAAKVNAQLRSTMTLNSSLGIRSEVDASQDRMQKKVRTSILQKIPVILVVGDKEETSGTVDVRMRSGDSLGPVRIENVADAMKVAIESRNDDALVARLTA